MQKAPTYYHFEPRFFEPGLQAGRQYLVITWNHCERFSARKILFSNLLLQEF